MTELSTAEAAVVQRFEAGSDAEESLREDRYRLPEDFPTDRFWSKVEKTDTCWNWRGTVNQGYGVIQHARKNYRAHRVAWAITHSGGAGELVLDHLCRNRACVNPDHLEEVTVGENVLRGVGPSALNFVKQSCPEGHPYDGANLKVRPGTGARVCRACANSRRVRLASRKEGCPQCERKISVGNMKRHIANLHADAAIAVLRGDS